MTKAPTPTEMSKRKIDNTNNATKKFDYTAIADRLRTVSWSNYGHPSSLSMNIEKGYSFLKSLKPIDFFDLYIYRNDKQSEITMVRGFKANLHQGCNNFLSSNGVQCTAVPLVALLTLLTFVSNPDMLSNPQARIQKIFQRGGGPNDETSDLKIQ